MQKKESDSSSGSQLSLQKRGSQGELRRKQIAESIRNPDETIHGIKKSDLLNHGFFKRQSQSFGDLADVAGPSERKEKLPKTGISKSPSTPVSVKELVNLDTNAKGEEELEELEDTCTSCRLPIDMCECQF